MPAYFIGLMSGTSMDGVDAVLVDLSNHIPILVETYHHTYPEAVHQDLQRLCHPGTQNELELAAQMDIKVARTFAEAVNELLNKSHLNKEDISAIGSHGQTIRHRPDNNPPFSVQIGDPNTIAELSGITTIADFRRRDMAAGGQGAPLVPAFHEAVFRKSDENRIILNIGGIANITILPEDPHTPVTGFDTGPGNTLMDQWLSKNLQIPMDRNGEIAGRGKIQEDLLQELLADPYFQRKPPKSTGREYFTLEWLEQKPGAFPITPEDLLATLCALTACSAMDAIRKFSDGCKRILVCGGGSHNKTLMQQLSDLAAPCVVGTTEQYGLPADWVEATAFAWLAQQTLLKRPGNLPCVTGARHPAILGGIFQS